MADLADIARELNVSSSLVSKVLNGRLGTTRVSAKTIRAIHAQAQNFNYQRNASAAALATGRQNVIGVFIHHVGVEGAGIMEAMTMGIAAEAAKHKLRLAVQYFEDREEFIAQRQIMQRGVMDGLILGGMHHEELVDMLNDVQENGVPVVTIHDKQLDPRFSNVGMHQEDVGRVATKHLIDQGCRRIAHICNMDERFEGYLMALRDAGIPFEPELVFEVNNYVYARGVEALASWKQRNVQFDGVFAQSDQQAVGFMNTFVRQGGRIPQDVKIIGVDNSPFTDFTVIPLSSVSQEDKERGRRAVQILLEQTASKDNAPSPRAEWVAPVLHARESTGITEVA
jgi:LacI family transcriptional regulator